MKTFFVAFTAAACALSVHPVTAAIIFDHFNVDEGHFNREPSFSGTTVGEDPSSTAERVTDVALEGVGSQLLHLVHNPNELGIPYRLRHLSGTGVVANNIGFQVTDFDDGYIGFYLKTNESGWVTSINLDGAGGTLGEMDGSTSLEIIGDGAWHLYEWSLDSFDWGAIPGIGGGHGGQLPNGSHTIDSIYLREVDFDPAVSADFHLDFVAKSDTGSIAEVIPEPSCAAMAMIGVVALAYRRRRP
ncbi:MAG TPA: hypothetical protein VGO90_17225 [Chthoniobacteraceae bacterium]|jgi:hypothetical protein|nr:hypothetical protein [Chthoniobacteraceae bacterium]